MIWVIGAFATNSYPNEVPATNIYAYDPARNTWNAGIEIPAGRRRGGAGLVVYNGKFYVVAGNTMGHNGGAVEWTDEYDPISNSWTELQDAPNKRDHFHAVLVGSEIYCVGGRESDLADGNVFNEVVSDVDVYDIGQGSWSTLSGVSLPNPRAAPGMAYVDGKILIMGGESDQSSSAFSRVDEFDPSDGSFTEIASMNHARHGTQAIVSGGNIFIAGGSPNRGGGNQRNMEVYGSNSPSGSASTRSELEVPAEVSIQEGSSIDISITHNQGNTGAFVNSLTITGSDADLFEFFDNDSPGVLSPDDPSLNQFLIPVGGTHYVGVRCILHQPNVDATLTIEFGGSGVAVVPLSTAESSTN